MTPTDQLEMNYLYGMFEAWAAAVRRANLPANTRDDYLRTSHRLLLKMWDELEKGDENASTEAA